MTNWESESIAKTASEGDKTSWGVPRTGGDPEEGDWSLLGGLSNEVSLELETADSRGHQADQGRVQQVGEPGTPHRVGNGLKVPQQRLDLGLPSLALSSALRTLPKGHSCWWPSRSTVCKGQQTHAQSKPTAEVPV